MGSKRKRDNERIKGQTEDLKGFFEELERESDRAVAILIAALLDYTLRQVLAAYFVNDEEEEIERLVDVEGPLATFSSRIHLAYLLGLISIKNRERLTAIREIRNLFAHQLHGLSFDETRIAEKCGKLDAGQETQRWNFVVCGVKLFYTLIFDGINITPRKYMSSDRMHRTFDTA